MIKFMLGTAAIVALLGSATAANADWPGKWPHHPKPSPEPPKEIVKYVDAKKHCTDRWFKGYLPVWLDKGEYEVEFFSEAYTPYFKWKYIKLDRVYVEYKDDWDVEKERVKEGRKEHIDISYKQDVKVYFKDKFCRDNKGYGKIVFKFKKHFEEPKEEEPPKGGWPFPGHDDDDKDHGGRDNNKHHGGGRW